ncbi:hypothetical protein POM88_010328 [Heracleum sosnowskyi]|uniref:Protein kinase domain-containing protein n=1 Tax=Heracleum sosnowskyi TaxID=360622 RepID=A0AAD8IVT6_9APIA|nr:hypothetical protein POM88_010328 [Heracleum sosnowskyi]
MEAQIADFGLAKEVPNADTHSSTSNLGGYTLHQNISKHWNLILVPSLVLVTGKLSWDEFFQDTETSLVEWMRDTMTSNDPERGIDPKLQWAKSQTLPNLAWSRGTPFLIVVLRNNSIPSTAIRNGVPRLEAKFE